MKPETKTNEEQALELINNQSDGITAHTDGGGMYNDLTVAMDELERFNGELLDELRELGYKPSGVHTGHVVEHDFTGLICFKEVDDNES